MQITNTEIFAFIVFKLLSRKVFFKKTEKAIEIVKY